MDIQDIVINRVKPSDVMRCIEVIKERAEEIHDEKSKEALLEAVDVLDNVSGSMYNLNWEKSLLVSMAAKAHESLLSPHEKHEGGWDPQDGWLVYINLPTGQVSFHIDNEVKNLLAHNVKVVKHSVWDGHGLSEKWKRIFKYITNNEEA